MQLSSDKYGIKATQNGLTPLMVACLSGISEAVSNLLELGAFIDDVDSDGNTALIHAVKEGHADVMKILLEQNASLDIQDNNGDTALHWAGNDTFIV